MNKALALIACGGALLAGGVFAGTVVGDDGGSAVTDRISGSLDPAASDAETVRSVSPVASASKSGKVKIVKGSSSIMDLPAGTAEGITLKCPSKHSALAAGFQTESPGIVAADLSPALKSSGAIDTRGMFVGVINISATDLGWRAWVTCAKGVKDVS